jgi:hypothetical protein
MRVGSMPPEADHLRNCLFASSALFALLMSACAAPVWMSGPGAMALPEGQVAVLEVASSFCVIGDVNSDIDKTVIYESGGGDYADHFRLTPGRYVIAYVCNYQHSAEVRRFDAVDLKPGRVYQVRSKKNYLSGKVKAWIEERETGAVVAGKK